MTLEDWNKREDYKIAWKAFSSSDAGSALLNLLFFSGLPVPSMPPSGVDFIDWNATLNSRREGYFEALRLLKSLTEDTKQKDDLPAPWEGQINETIEE
jgi:hypothetical protein